VHRAVFLFTPRLSLVLIALRSYPRKDGQAELTWVTGYILHMPTEMVHSLAEGHPSEYSPSQALINFVNATNDVTN